MFIHRFRCILCIYYPPPWIAAVALLKAVRCHNVTRDPNKSPKFYFLRDWFKIYDATNTLSLNLLQYISDEVDACDESVISVKDYTTTPAEYFGAKDLALLKRINLVRTTSFHRLPIPMQDDLRNCFKLEDTEFIELRCQKIKDLEIKNQKLKKLSSNNATPTKPKETRIKQSSPPNNNHDPSTEWVFGVGPLQKEIIKKLKAENNKLEHLVKINLWRKEKLKTKMMMLIKSEKTKKSSKT